MGIVIFWILGSILCAVVARTKGRSGVAWGLVSLLFCPLLVLIALCAVPNILGQPAPPVSSPPSRKHSDFAYDSPEGIQLRLARCYRS